MAKVLIQFNSQCSIIHCILWCPERFFLHKACFTGRLSGSGSQFQPRYSGLPLPIHLLHYPPSSLTWGDTEVFPKPAKRYILSSLSWVCLRVLYQMDKPRLLHLGDVRYAMPKTPQLEPFHTEQRLYSEPLPNVHAPHPVSKKPLILLLISTILFYRHYPQLIAIGKVGTYCRLTSFSLLTSLFTFSSPQKLHRSTCRSSAPYLPSSWTRAWDTWPLPLVAMTTQNWSQQSILFWLWNMASDLIPNPVAKSEACGMEISTSKHVLSQF